jgi:N-acetylneuraminic acid mutarotase
MNLPALRFGIAAIALIVLPLGAMAADKPDTSDPLIKVAEYHMKLARRGPAIAASGDYLYIFGGFGGSTIYQAERLNIQTGQVELLPAKFLQRVFHNAVEHEGKFHIFGGLGRPRPREPIEKSIEIYDPATNEVVLNGEAPTPRIAAGVVKMGHQALVVGGVRHDQNGSTTQTNAAEIYDLNTRTWSDAPAMPTVRAAPAVAVGQYILVPGGYVTRTKLKTVEMFVPQEGGWKKLPDLSMGAQAHSAAFLGQWLFLFGDNQETDRIIAYELSTRKTTRLKPGTAHMRYSAAITHGDRIYVVGGTGEDESVSNGKILYDFRVGMESDLIQVFALNPDYKPAK